MPGFKSGSLADQEGIRDLPEPKPGRAVFEDLDELAALLARGLEDDTLGEDMHLRPISLHRFPPLAKGWLRHDQSQGLPKLSP